MPQAQMVELLRAWLHHADRQVRQNLHAGIQWVPEFLLPSLTGDISDAETDVDQVNNVAAWDFFHVYRMNETAMAWEDEWRDLRRELEFQHITEVAVDYTDPTKYSYPEIRLDLPEPGTYPEFRPLGNVMEAWPQDDDYQGHITETLLHFNYSDPVEREAARKYRDAELPFKIYNVPELTAAGELWTDEYLTKEFDESGSVAGSVQETLGNYNLFFNRWDMFTFGLPPARYNDWTYAKWSEHAKYADASRLSFDQPHFYFQAAYFLGELYTSRTKWPFFRRDLPSFSYAETGYKETFFAFHPDPQKGLQCRFGERGLLTASHYDGMRNMVAMVTGAKRFILSPPRECSKLGIIHALSSPLNRHSILNYKHFQFLANNGDDVIGMSDKERAWLERAAGSQTVETVLKAGQVLYLPSHWIHYVVNLQKSAQCNVRSAMDAPGNPEFGGQKEVHECKDYEHNIR
jgi:hypothetical protein